MGTRRINIRPRRQIIERIFRDESKFVCMFESRLGDFDVLRNRCLSTTLSSSQLIPVGIGRCDLINERFAA